MISERNAFRLVVAIAGLVPVGAGAAGALFGAQIFADGSFASNLSLDSHMRYLSGLLFGIGLGFWSTLGRPEIYGGRYRLLGAVVVLGGLARALGLIEGEPNLAMRLALVMELAVTPAICLWQARLARSEA